MMSAQSNIPQWEDFVKADLLTSGLISGVSLITDQGVPVYSHGDLSHLQKNDLQQFSTVFKSASQEKEDALLLKGFTVTWRDGTQTHMKIYEKTHCSIYATGPGNCDGLTVSNLPYGILICTFHHPVQQGQAIQLVECFSNKLRA
ncbi:uncharacterized protein LOC121372285 [Gigantopelta aegis]|uniref:uncharacterized protein LOC121372285 n=1 Tax=Gigantopelta aegis TaxID=1735272 RepID=UPI001B889803|nr:uncharacterized protein LOC121372285 [Gigantopelta aegis]XP_041354511.1 uncharacterized protein LOC121372285 [Gigantopelta aegis]XP_041354512.1 uncharacterized protein LOC121372285 [Gigantopelta aegis]